MAGRVLSSLPNATTVEIGDKFLIQQGVSSKQIDEGVVASLYKDHATSYNKNPADGSAHNADDVAKNGGGTLQDTADEVALDYQFRTGVWANFMKSEKKTGVVDIAKTNTQERPYRFDSSGNELKDIAPILGTQYIDVVQSTNNSMVANSPFEAGAILVALSCSESAPYRILTFKNNQTTQTASLATSNSDTTGYRNGRVQSAVSLLVANRANQVVNSGTFNNLNYPSSLLPTFTGGSNFQYISSGDIGSKLTYANVPVVNGLVNMSFLKTAGGSPTVDVTVAGVTTSVNLVGSTVLGNYTFPAYGLDTTTVVIENKSAGSTFVNFIGFWFSELNKWNGAFCDKWGYYRNDTNYADYINNNSENDFVVKEFYSQIYGCGYHGGETAITNKWLDGGIEFTPSSTPKLSNKLTFQASATIDWNPVGQATVIEVTRKYSFIDCGYYLETSVSGDFTATELYSGLFGVSELFSQVESPISFDLSALANMERKELAKASRVRMRNPTTNQLFCADLTMQAYDNGALHKGVHIWKVDGSYKKMYYTTVGAGRIEYPEGFVTVNKYTFR